MPHVQAASVRGRQHGRSSLRVEDSLKPLSFPYKEPCVCLFVCLFACLFVCLFVC